MTKHIHLRSATHVAGGDFDHANPSADWQAIGPADIAFDPAFPLAAFPLSGFPRAVPNTFTAASTRDGGSPPGQVAVTTMAGSISTDGSPLRVSIAAGSQLAPSVGPSTLLVASTSITSTGLVINATYDSSVTNLATSDPALEADFKSAVQTAVQFYESKITNSITVNINFGWGEYAGTTVTGLSSNKTTIFDFSYGDIYSALQATDTTSSVQQTAFATLSASDPTSGATFAVTTAEGKALGLNSFFTGNDGSIGLNSSNTYTWTGGSIAAGTYDAVGALEHEISEVLGRISTVGANNTYTPLDLFRYTAADGGANDASGSAAGVQDEPFVAGYNSNAFSYFSYDGKTVTNPFDTPAHVAAGADPGDWSNTVANDSFGYASLGESLLVTPTDLNVLNVLGYDLAVACFAAGTRIATLDGEVPVESLRPGTMLRSVFGGDARVTWIGHRQIDCTRYPTPERIWPVRIAAGAFEPGLPRRALTLSPDHAVYVQGALIPIKLLINHTTIRQIEVPSVTYYHIEVERHDVVLAEGLPAETYLDTGNRSAFDNGGEVVALHPDFAGAQKARADGSRAPLLVEPWAVEGTWRALADRAALLGRPVPSLALESDPKLNLRIGDRRHEPVAISGDRYFFVIPTVSEPISLVSHAARPSDLRPWVDDRRQLGVMVRRLTVRNGAYRRDVALDDPALDRGWWQVEWHGGSPVRWTTGEAELSGVGTGLLEVALAGVMEHVADTGPDRQVAADRLAG